MVFGGTQFDAGGQQVQLDWKETGTLLEALREFPQVAEDLRMAIDEGRELIPGSDEEAAVLMAALELLLRRGQRTPAMRRLNFALRSRRD